MTFHAKKAALALTLSSTVALSGCQTTGDTHDQLAGAGIGAAIGAGVGALVTGNARGAAAGAAIGGLLGFTAVKINQYHSRQVRSQKADTRIYGLSKAVSSPQVRIRKGSSSPKTVRSGQSIAISTDYSVLLPSGANSARVTENWVLKKDGRRIAKLPSKTSTRQAGGWAAQAEITVPNSIEPGTYVIEHLVKSGSSYDSDESTFVVRA